MLKRHDLEKILADPTQRQRLLDGACNFINAIRDDAPHEVSLEDDSNCASSDSSASDAALSTESVGCKCDGGDPCKICSGEEKNPVVVEVPLPPPGEPNANGDIFPEGIEIPPSPANDPSPLREMFTVTHTPVTDLRRLVPMITALLERFDVVSEKMRPALCAHGARDQLCDERDEARTELRELRIKAGHVPLNIDDFMKCGLNGFAVKLLGESFKPFMARSKDQSPVRFEFDGVDYTLGLAHPEASDAAPR